VEVTPYIFTAKVMHKRLFPKVNSFAYGVYYIVLPLSLLTGGLSLQKLIRIHPQNHQKIFFKNLSYNKFGKLSFYDKDHGGKDGKNLNQWVRKILKKYDLNDITNEVFLISMPRVIGYVFNPVSFWFCLDKEKNIRAVLCEVNNTFGETHNYLCAHENGGIIKENDFLTAKKIFHVSPFLKREGYYKFHFDLKEKKLIINIDFYNIEGKKQLITQLSGNLIPMTEKNLRQCFWRFPVVTIKTIFLIHWQALKIIFKGIKYIQKPNMLKQKLSKSQKIKKM
jgi:DUF1365 family protein